MTGKVLENIYVTRPFLPPLTEFLPLLEEIWQSRVLTNAGPFHQKFEAALMARLSLSHVSLVTNGTVALTLAIRAMELTGEVITTPFSFVATSHELMLAGLKPRFVDINESDFNINSTLIGDAIGSETSAILAVHCYGNPCDTIQIRSAAEPLGLAVMYDAAHAFGVLRDGTSILGEGDLSTVSFHATKAFNTFEGGLVVSATEKVKKRVNLLRNFGIESETEVSEVGFNGKMSEFNSALGILQLNYFEEVIRKRSERDAIYREYLADIDGIEIASTLPGITPNYCYFPIRVLPAFPVSRDSLYEGLRSSGIFTRRYFYPLISNLPAYRNLPSASPDNLPVANRIAAEILCLPIYPDLSFDNQITIINGIRTAAGQPSIKTASTIS